VKRAATLVVLLTCACREAPPAAPPPPTATAAKPVAEKRDPGETLNLLDMAHGAAVVSRTAELMLEASAIRAIDGDQNTGWSTPPGDTNQSIVISMPARARVEEIGIRSPLNDQLRVNNVSVEASTDGRTFTTLAEPALQSANDTQTFPVTATDAQYLRLTITGATGGIATISSVQAHGKFVTTPKPGPIAQCWSVNGLPTQFSEQAGAVRGRSGSGSAPLRFDGGVEGALYRFAWVRGPDRGYTAITVSPAGEGLSGIRWFVKPIPKNFGGSWFGEKGDCPPSAPFQSLVAHFLGRGESYPLFGLHFDDQDRVVIPSSEEALAVIAGVVGTAGSRKVEILSRELRENDDGANMRRARARLDSLRTVLAARRVNVGLLVFTPSDTPVDPDALRTDLFRAMNSVVEISLK
jgi:hypothetical protein